MTQLSFTRPGGFKKFLSINGFVWEKETKKGQTHFVMGHGTRGATESCLIAYNGSIGRLIKDKSVRNIFRAKMPVDENNKYIHSAKPDEFFDLVDKLVGTNCNCLEMFARKPRENFDRFGDEA